MDQRLLRALENIGDGLEALVEALESQEEARSESAKALQAGDFGKQLESISSKLESIKSDTQEILKRQNTLIGISREKEREKEDKKTEEVEGAGETKKKNRILQGIGTILLIAIAVLAIGMAFKLVGKIDFLSVIGLSIAIVIIAIAFERVAKLDLDIKKAAIASLVMIMMSAAVTVSSWILSKMSTISVKQFLTAVGIAGLFYFVGPRIASMISAFNSETEIEAEAEGQGKMKFKSKKLDIGKLMAAVVFIPLMMVTMSLAIMLSSKILSMVTPMKPMQMVSAMLIAGMFAIVANAMKGLILALTDESEENVMFRGFGGGRKQKGLNIGKLLAVALILPIIMIAFSAGITMSSWILRLITPISLMQSLTAIMIGITFAIVGRSMQEIATGISIMDKIVGKKASWLLPLVLVAVAAAITMSSWIMRMITPIGFTQALTAIVIAGIFWLMGFSFQRLAIGVSTIYTVLGKGASWKLPLVLVAIALAITASSWILSMIQPISWKQMLTALIITLIFVAISYFMDKIALAIVILERLGKGKTGMFKIPIFFVAIATAIMLSSHILAETKPIDFIELLRILVFSIVLAIAAFVLGVVSFILIKLIGLTTILKGVVAIVALAGAIAASSILISKGKYKVYPDWKWSVFVALALAAFAIAAKIASMVGIKNIIIGSLGMIVLAAVVMVVSHILGAGNYKKYPDWKWALGATLSIGAFAILAVLIGPLVTGPQAAAMLAGSAAIIVLSAVILAVSHILAAGDYQKPVPATWTIKTILAIGAFAALAIPLGLMVAGPQALIVAAGVVMILGMAELIVKVSKTLAEGSYNLPGFVNWGMSVALLYATFTPIMIILGTIGLASAVVGLFGPNPWEKAKEMTVSLAQTIVDVSHVLKKGDWVKGPTKDWAEGVAIALGAFAPIYQMLVDNAFWDVFGMGGIGPDDYAKGIKVVSQGIIIAAKFFAENKVAFQNGPPKEWAEGVGKAIAAFSPVYKVLLGEGRSLFDKVFGGAAPTPADMKKAIITISQGIVEAAKFFGDPKVRVHFKPGGYPDKKWGQGVGAAIASFAPVFQALSNTPWYRKPADTIAALGRAIRTVSTAIVDAGVIFRDGGEVYRVRPNLKWSENVAEAIKAFGGVFEYMNANSGWFTSENEVIDDMCYAIRKVADAITYVGSQFSTVGDGWNHYPKDGWGGKVSAAVESMVYLSKFIIDQFGESDYEIGYGLYGMSYAVRRVASNFTGSKSWQYASTTWAKNIDWVMRKMSDLDLYLSGYSGSNIEKMGYSISSIAKKIGTNIKYFDARIPKDYIPHIRKVMLDFQSLVRELLKNEESSMSMADKFLSKFGWAKTGPDKDPIVILANRMIILAKGYDTLANSLTKLAAAMRSLNITNVKQLGGLTNELSKAANAMGKINNIQASKGSTPTVDKKAQQKAGKEGEDKKKDEKMFKDQMKKIVKLLESMERNTSTLDDWIAMQSMGRIPAAGGSTFR